MTKIQKYYLFIILIISITARAISIYLFGDTEVSNEWGILLNNLENNDILSVHSVQGTPVPNVFMPPLYPFFLYAIKIFFNNQDLYLWTV